MPVSDTDPFHQEIPHRPALSDVQNGPKANDESGPPPPDAPSAEEDNCKSKLIVSYGRVTPLAVISVEFAAGAPRVFSMGTVRDDDTPIASIVVADNGT